MHFSRFPAAMAGMIGATQALVPDLLGDGGLLGDSKQQGDGGLLGGSKQSGDGGLSPAAFDCGASWDNEVLFEGIVGAETETEAAVHLGLNLKEAQVEGNIAIEPLEDFLEEPSLRLDLAGVKAYVELDLSASAAVFQTVELVVSPELEIDAGFLEVALGAAFALDLVVGVDAAIDLSAGFYVSFNAGDYVDLSIITKEVINTSLDGLVTKALPVGVGAEVDLSAGIEVMLGLRLRSHVKLEAGLDLLGLDLLDAGAEVAIWADLLTHTIGLVETDNCVVSVDNKFALELGVAVDVSVDVLDLLDISLAPEVTVKLAGAVGAEVCMDNRGLIGGYLELDADIEVGDGNESNNGGNQVGNGEDGDKPKPLPTVTGAPNGTVTDAPMVTRTVSNTKTFTITSCPARVMNCPADQTQKVVTSTVMSSVTVCPADQTDAPEPEPTKSPKKVHTVTDTLTTVVPCEPTSSTFTPPPNSKPPVPTVTMSDSTTVCPTETGGDDYAPPTETGGDDYTPPVETGGDDYTPPAPTETPGHGDDYTPPAPQPPSNPTMPVIPPPVQAPPPGSNQTWTSSVVTPTGPAYTPPPPMTPSPTPPPTAGAESVKLGMAIMLPAIAMML